LINPIEKKTLDLVEQNIKRLLQQINQLIDLSELEAGSMKLKVSRNDFVPFLSGLIMNLEPAAKLKNIEIKLHTPVDHLNIYFDQDKIERILFNLISNAIKYSPEGGNILVVIELRSERLYIKVKRQWRRHSSEKLDLIFKETRGLGIGLPLTKKLVALHKGEIQVISTPGNGIYLYILAEHE